MNEDFVTYEQAAKLKELGFDWGCRYYYEVKMAKTKLSYFSNISLCNPNVYKWAISAPTLSQAQKWLREKRIYLYIKPLVSKNFCVFEYVIDRMDTIDRIESKPQFDTYEQALSIGIDKALELLKKKNKMEDFVTFGQALKLKELGFDECCHNRYNVDKEIVPNVIYNRTEVDSDDLCFNVNERNIGDISAPTIAQAQKWLREVKETEVIVNRLDDVYCYTIYGEIVNVTTEQTFDTYEQALSAGIDKGIELLKTN